MRIILCSMFMIIAIQAQAEGPLVQQLGLPAGSRVLVVHADDVGMCYGAHQSFIETMDLGAVTTGSTMVPCSWFPITARAYVNSPTLDIGIHLTLTSEWKNYRWGPIASRDLVPKLIDKEGYLFRDVMPVYASIGNDTSQVEIEIQAQIDFAKNMGLQPTHIDSHMGTLYYREDLFKLTCNMALRNDLPFMVFNYSREPFADNMEASLPYYTQELTDKLASAGFPMIDYLIMNEKTGKTDEEGFNNYCKVISDLKPGVTLMILHLGMEGPEMQNISGSWKSRAQQYRLFSDPRMLEHIRKEGITLMGWQELKERVWDQRDRNITEVF